MQVKSATNNLNVDSVNMASDSSKTEACTIMKLSKDENKGKWMFKSETVIKNDKYGIVVWLETNNIKKNNLRYQVYLLEKSSSSWIFKYGFIATTVNNGSQTNIASLDEPKSIDVSYAQVTSDSSDSISPTATKYYSGIWEGNDNGDENSLFNAAFKFIKKESFFVESYNAAGFLADYIYKNNELSKYDKSANRTGELVKWFEPFKNKKGKWNNLKSYCKNKSLTRNINEETKNFLKTYCYKKD